MLRNALTPSYIHDVGVAQVFDKLLIESYFFSSASSRSIYLVNPCARHLHLRNYEQLKIICRAFRATLILLWEFPFVCLLFLFYCLPYLRLFVRTSRSCSFNEHFLRAASLFLPSRWVSTLYLESHLHHYDISGGQMRTATYQRIF